MKYIETGIKDGIATLTLSRGKVNALNGEVVKELGVCLQNLEKEPDIKALVLTGRGPFFSFGFDIPEFLSFTRADFKDYLFKFTDLYTRLFLYPKPVVAALNGHTIAGGCMLALACDYRILVTGNAKISLNEIAFGSSVFAGSTEMLRFWVGSANASEILYSGTLYTANEALGLGLVQEATKQDMLLPQSCRIASELGARHLPAFTSIKRLLRKTIADNMVRREKASISEFVDIWYSEHTWDNIKKIRIH